MSDFGAPRRTPRLPFSGRVTEAAERLLATNHYVSIVDVLLALGLLAPAHVESWKRCRVDHLESQMQGFPKKVGNAVELLQNWARMKGLRWSEALYRRASPSGPMPLRFTPDGDPERELIYRTHFVSRSLPEKTITALEERQNRAPDPVVFQVSNETSCSECGLDILKDELLMMEAEQPLCMECAGWGEMEFLPAGDTALTRRASKYSTRKAVVVRFNRSRKRYERQGILAEAAAIARAEQECSEDAEERAKAREKAVVARRGEDERLTLRMAERMRRLFPHMPTGEAERIARHTALRGSGRVGRSASGRALEDDAMTAAVRAAIRHHHTDYDQLLMSGLDRESARRRVAGQIADILEKWA